MKTKRYIVLLIMFACVCALAHAQTDTDTIRYVHPNGSYSNDGKSWATAKNRVQDAINELHEYLDIHDLTSGSVYIAAGTYTPTESTEASGGSLFNTSFKIYAGIHVYGGFNPDAPEEKPGDRMMINGKKCSENWSDPSGVGTTSGEEIASQWDLQNVTILTGNHTSTTVTYTFDSIRGRFNTTYPASSYHVVWFATNDKYDTASNELKDHFRPLEYPASLDGCVISSGNASTRNTTVREHTAYGGGVYMVGNSYLRNCIIERCNATMRGGGIYADGGGVIEFCKIMQCQSSGVGVVEGYGGGVCIDQEGSIGHSHIMSCAARCGGGLLICHVNDEYPWSVRTREKVLGVNDTITSWYSPYATACVINNNTANAEGGGIYLAEGGTVNHCTVCGNNCSGRDVTYYGRRHGRTGGIYIRNCGLIFNSVFWGNRCDANNDIQFASVRQKSGEAAKGFEIYAYHTAFMNHDITDWTGVTKDNVFSLDQRNMPEQGSTSNHPCFFHPTVVPTDWSHIDRANGIYGAGVFTGMYPYYFPGPRIWHLTSYSALDQKGVQWNESVQGASPWLIHAHTDYGVVSNPYEPVSTLGALVRKTDPIKYALVPQQGVEGRLSSDPIPTLFIDPNRKGVFDGKGQFVVMDEEGHSWDAPIKEFGEAISYFRQYLVDDPGNTHHYWMPKLDENGDTVKTDGKIDSVRYDYIQILVKEGKLTTVGPGNYLDRNIRTAAVRVESHMRLYGGYPSSLTGTDTRGRNPQKNVTKITSNMTGINTAAAFENNSAHVIAMVNVEHTIVDGFTLSDAHTHNVRLSNSAVAGGGVLINNATTPQEKRIHMFGNQLRNSVINNCEAPKGAAVYVNGEHKNSEGYVCYAELKMVNCVVRNNTSDYEETGLGFNDHGIITANGRAYIEVEHCDVVNNVGYPFKADSKTTDTDEPITCTHPEHDGHAYHGYIRVNNSIIYCNGMEPLDDRADLGKDPTHQVLSVYPDGQDYVFGEHDMFDFDLRLHNLNPLWPEGFFDPDFDQRSSIPEDFVPGGDSPINFGASLHEELPADRNNKANLTRTDTKEPTYPTFVNPSRNVGHSPTGDKPLYGGSVTYTPMTTNPCVNAARSEYEDFENYDRTDTWPRNRGGAPDLGAIENSDLPEEGAVIYVTPDGAGKRDGSSWDNAIAGNTVYRLYGAPAAEGDSIDEASGARLINKSSGEPVSTEDNRYCGGFATKFVYPIFYDFGKAYARDVELNVYEGGAEAGRVDTMSVITTSTTSLTDRRYNNGIIPDTIVPTVAFNTEYPYGEMSGASRYTYRAQGNYSPLTEDASGLMFNTPGMTTVPSNAAGVINTGQLTLTNERIENYVSGLQYAVEKASSLNKTYHKDSVQVWVGAGKYSDYKGYVMRDSVSVYGGFPAGKFSAPGMAERKALMSAVVAIPKSLENADLDAEDYETILQISDVNPKATNTTINTAAIKFNDNGQSVKLYINNNISRYTDNTTIHHYQWDEGEGKYVLDHTDNDVINSEKIKRTWSANLYDTESKKRTVLRKRVLQMPDVTATTYIHSLGLPTSNAGGKYGDNLQHYERLIKEGRLSNVKPNGTTINGRHQDPNYKEYNKVYWDGFTIRHGFLYNQRMAHGGGAGVCMYEGARLVNCIITNNWAGAGGVKGGGVFCDGSTSTIENCFILNNTTTQGTGVSNNTLGQQQAGGLFLYEGTCFNTLIANNHANGPGGALGLCVAKFYNNTLAYNTSNNDVGGVRVAVGSEPAIFMANCIIFGNSGKALSVTSGSATVAPFINCYIQSATQLTAKNEGNFLKALADHTEGVTDGNFGRKNTFLNKVNPSAANTPFAADVVDGVYNSSNPGAKAANNFALRQVDGIHCINSGEEDFEGAMYEAVRAYRQRNDASLNPTDEQIKSETFYKNVVGVQLPSNDVVYAKRVQDCQVDIGAYEFNAAYNIMPDTVTHPGRAIFYVTFIAPGGDASSNSPGNAACRQKLQLVLDAAGRYKYSLMTKSRYSSVKEPVAGEPDKSWTVEVWLEGDDEESTTSDTYHEQYTPTRSTKHNIESYQDNSLDYSFIVPRGIQVKGGYMENFYHYEDADGKTVAAGTEGAHIVDDRDPLTYRTVFSGNVVSSTGAAGQTFHVVTFTQDLFDPNENYYMEDKGGGVKEPIRNQLAAYDALPDAETHRAVLDGLFIEDGNADATDELDRIGAGAVVTDYAHIRNCVVMNNNAAGQGGGLYLKPQALVSGTIVKYNTAETGGGIYIESPSEELAEKDRHAAVAHVFYSTICENTGRASAGGLFFDNTYARINSSAVWHNNANDNANVAGNFARTADTIPYPMNCCAVESRRLEGQGNIELSSKETEGVRWDRQDPFNSVLYYPIEMSSTLARAGISYTEWNNFYTTFATLDSIDIAGVSRKRWTSDGTGKARGFAWDTDTLVTKNNDVIDIGARAINKNFEVRVDSKYVMHRLFVVHTELIDSKAARALQDNTLNNDTANMYRQMGSCIYNPFHRLSDAFEYVIKARKMDSTRYRNTRFEIFIEQGTYYPMRDAYMRQGAVRMNTFLVPEALLIVGGVDSRPASHKYGQEGFISPFSTKHVIGNGENVVIRGTGDPANGIPDYTIKYERTDSIRLRDARHRPMRDNNLNSVIEPWELERQTILSGNAVAGEDFTHIYHVITCHADNRYVGPRPIKYGSVREGYNPKDPSTYPALDEPLHDDKPDEWDQENDLSILARTIGFDGIQITGGYANHVDPTDTVDVFVKETYFRGGGIYVDGNWWEGAGATPPDMTRPAQNNIPIVVENCFFTNNMAGNGGAIYSNGGIYAYGNRFTQNYSQGPMTKDDQKFIPWTAGGCIATNAFCGVSNSLFDNNEARRGLYPLTAASADEIPDADARQGFGGCLSVAAQSNMRVMNCHFVRNKAVAYSAIYNFKPNSHYVGGDEKHPRSDSMQFAFNTLFWGNEVFDLKGGGIETLDCVEPPSQDQIDAFNNKYKASRAGVFHYDGDEWNRYEQLFHNYDSTYRYWAERGEPFKKPVTDTLDLLRAQGNKMEGLYFCSYRKGYGPTGMKPTQDGYLLTEDEYLAWKDPRSRTVETKEDENDDHVESYKDLWTLVGGNNNVLINRINTATDGPNFRQPSLVAGIDGYMQNADWLLARLNLTTDQGWGFLKQKVERGISYYITRWTEAEHFDTEAEAIEAANAALGTDTCTSWSVLPIKGLPVASFLPKAEQTDTAMYNFLAWRYGKMMSESNAPLPLGDQYYMSYTRSSSDSETSGSMDRISKHPKMGETDVYIDIGIYEYQYVQLDIKGQEIDTVWVATKAKDPLKHDGLTWETPTTDLQSAIELLMSSHNNHDKYVCLMGDDDGGTFSPQDVLDNRRAFIITSTSPSPLLPDSAMADVDYGVNSLTFLGGYSFDVKDTRRDPYAHPTVMEMPNVGNESQRNQLFIVEDMTRQMLQANFVGEYTSRDSVVVPIVFDGMTFINPYSVKEPSESSYSNLGGSMTKKGGAAIYYRWQRRYNDGTPDPGMALHPDSALIDGKKTTLPKLTISNCIFMDNGKRTVEHAERSPAVRIDHGGGSSLIVNSLFHSNAGAPVYARTFDIIPGSDLAQVPNDVYIINCTSALNDGHIRLESDASEVHNSLIWLDDLHNDTTIQLQMGASDQWDKTTNKNREGIDKRMTNNAVWGCFQVPEWGADKSTGDPYKNHPLATNNNDVYKGPGFLLPFVTATTSDERRERSFRLNPSIRTAGMADTTVYRSRVFFRQYPVEEDAPKQYWRRSNGFKALTATNVMEDYDLAFNSRYSNGGMERGAYECLVTLQRVLYVRPDILPSASSDGSSWEKAFGQGQLQNAINAAAVYTYMNQDKPRREDRKAYVYVKGTSTSKEYYHIEARDGVYVYGSIAGSFIDTAWIDTEKKQFTNEECHRYKNYVRASRSGLMASNAPQTKIASVHIAGDKFETGFLLDGFVITNPNTHTNITPVYIDNEMAVVRNCLIVDNHVSKEAHPVVDVQKGLLYNCLIYNDSAEAIVRVGEKGLVLNNTIVADHADVTPLDDTNATDGAVQNNIAGQKSELNCFAPYMTPNTPYALPTSLTNNASLAYQLHEHSTMINTGTMDDALPELFDPYIEDSVILFKWDRDLLGNPRKIGSSVDMGALETWYVAEDQAQEITALTNRVGHLEPSKQQRDTAYTKNYGGNRYPHPGSVVYLMDSAAMSMQYDETGDFKDFDNATITLRPGFMLLKPGASFYGNGHKAQLNYVAAEKRFVNQRYSMTALPYNYSIANITTSSHDAEGLHLSALLSPSSALGTQLSTYQYSGDARSDKDYIFQTDNSTLWLPVDTLNRTATEGYLMDFGEVVDTVLRFNAFAPSGEYVYAEDGNDKFVYLKQNDHRTAGVGSELDFTRQEDMGWNMKGLPWLVSDYRTDTILWAGNYLRQMYIPHVLYRMDGMGEYISEPDNVYSSRSWDRGATLSMGAAFLTQTATTQAQEQIIFHLPLYSRNSPAARPLLRMRSRRPAAPAPGKRYMANEQMVNSSDILTFIPDSSASKNVSYTYGRDGLKWHATDRSAQLYLLDSQRRTRFSLLGAAPIDVDIPLGVYIPAASFNAQPATFNFSLPEPAAFADYDYIWLIDYDKRRYVNLLSGDCEVELEPGEYNGRFAIRIGRFPATDGNGRREYVVYAYDGNLYVRGLVQDDRIRVYAPSGQLVRDAVASYSEFTMPLLFQSGYVVTVNDRPYKVLNQ